MDTKRYKKGEIIFRQGDESHCMYDIVIKKKNEAVNERKKYIDLNIELKHEIEAKKIKILKKKRGPV